MIRDSTLLASTTFLLFVNVSDKTCGKCGGTNLSKIGRCRPCAAAYMRKWTAKNKEKVSQQNKAYKKKDGGRVYRNSQLKNNFGITIEDYEVLEKLQKHACAICKRPETSTNQHGIKRLAVDHCHTTHIVRGLLCEKCNRGLGMFNDDTELLIAAAHYLQNGN